jgi:hypothetical protein
MMLPDTRVLGDTLFLSSTLRCIVAGCIAGMFMNSPSHPLAAAGAAAAGILAGMTGLTLVAPGAFVVGGAVVGLFVGPACAAALSFMMSRDLRTAAQVITVGLLVVVFLLDTGVLPGVAREETSRSRMADVSRSQQPESYTNDGLSFLRTYELMKTGWGYYPAFRQGVIDDKRHDASFLTSPFNYREPFVFYLWKVLPGSNGGDLWRWFVLFAVVLIVCSYVLASSLAPPGAALLAPVALLSWFYYFVWQGSWFLLTEVWAAGFGLIAVTLLVKRKAIPSILFLTAAVAAREFMLVLVPTWILVWWVVGHQKSRLWFALAAIAGPVAVLAAHFVAVPHTSTGVTSVAAWTHGGIDRLISALMFGFGAMPGWQWLSLAIAVAAVAGAALAQPRWLQVALLATALLPMAFLLSFSVGMDGYYWGAFYAPIMISIAPAVFARLSPSGARSAKS